MDKQQQDAIAWTNSSSGIKESPANKQMQREQKQLTYKLLDFLDMT